MSDGQQITTQTGPNQVVHQLPESKQKQELDVLFAKAINKGANGGQSSWLNKNLPASFFEPSRRSHSRESSIDGSQELPPQNVHFRGKSCPASMNNVGLPNASPNRRIAPSHQRTGSLDVILDERPSLDHIPLPPGWEVAFTPDGKRYFIE